MKKLLFLFMMVLLCSITIAVTEYTADITLEVGISIQKNNEICTTISSQETCDLLNSTADVQFDNTTSCGLIPNTYNCSYDYGNVIITIDNNNNTYSTSTDLQTTITTLVPYTFNQTVAIDYASVQSIIQGQNAESEVRMQNFIIDQQKTYIQACNSELPICQTQFAYCNSSLGSCEVVRDERKQNLDDYKTILTIMTIITLVCLGAFVFQYVMNKKGGPGGVRKSFSDTFRSQ